MKQIERNSIIISFSLLTAVIVSTPVDAFSPVRVWSTSRGIAGKMIGRASSKPTKPTPSTSSSQLEDDSIATKPTPAQDPRARASLRSDLEVPEQESKKKRSSSAETKEITLRIAIDRRTDREIRAMSERTGIPYNDLLYRFLQTGHAAHAKRLLYPRY